jgi:hypothetical protein
MGGRRLHKNDRETIGKNEPLIQITQRREVYIVLCLAFIGTIGQRFILHLLDWGGTWPSRSETCETERMNSINKEKK